MKTNRKTVKNLAPGDGVQEEGNQSTSKEEANPVFTMSTKRKVKTEPSEEIPEHSNDDITIDIPPSECATNDETVDQVELSEVVLDHSDNDIVIDILPPASVPTTNSGRVEKAEEVDKGRSRFTGWKISECVTNDETVEQVELSVDGPKHSKNDIVIDVLPHASVPTTNNVRVEKAEEVVTGRSWFTGWKLSEFLPSWPSTATVATQTTPLAGYLSNDVKEVGGGLDAAEFRLYELDEAFGQDLDHGLRRQLVHGVVLPSTATEASESKANTNQTDEDVCNQSGEAIKDDDSEDHVLHNEEQLHSGKNYAKMDMEGYSLYPRLCSMSLAPTHDTSDPINEHIYSADAFFRKSSKKPFECPFWISYIENEALEKKFDEMKEEFMWTGLETEDILLFYTANTKCTDRICRKGLTHLPFVRGFSRYPTDLAPGKDLILCEVLLGHQQPELERTLEIIRKGPDAIKNFAYKSYDSLEFQPMHSKLNEIFISSPKQILPYCVITAEIPEKSDTSVRTQSLWSTVYSYISEKVGFL